MNTWDEKKRLRNIKDHGIDFADLEYFFDQPMWSYEDRHSDHAELRIHSLGMINGKVVVVIWTPSSGGARIISCRYGEKHETRDYFENVFYPGAD